MIFSTCPKTHLSPLLLLSAPPTPTPPLETHRSASPSPLLPFPFSPSPFLLLLLFVQISLLPSLPVLPDLNPTTIQLSLLFPTSSLPTIVLVFPEKSNVVGATHPLDLPDNLLPVVSTVCSTFTLGHLPSHSHCYLALTAWLYTAYSTTALAACPLPMLSSLNLPILPDDSEACVGSVECALHDHGILLPCVNGMCDNVHCYCNIYLWRLRS